MEVVDPDAIHAAREELARGDRHARCRTSCSRRTGSDGVGGRRSVAARPRACGGCARSRSALIAGGRRGAGGRACQGAVRRGRQHDRPPGRARRARVARRRRSAQAALDAFYERFHDDPLVIDKWFALQAAAQRADTLDQVLKLAGHPDFTHDQPQPAALAGRDVRRQPVGVPRRRRARLSPSSPT